MRRCNGFAPIDVMVERFDPSVFGFGFGSRQSLGSAAFFKCHLQAPSADRLRGRGFTEDHGNESPVAVS
jgi:hypothetical protein